MSAETLREIDYFVKKTARKLTKSQLNREQAVYKSLPDEVKRIDTKSGVITNLSIFVRRMKNRGAATKSRRKKNTAVELSGGLRDVTPY